jgi:putative transposase
VTSVICAKQALVAQAQLQTWAANWNGTRPGAAASVREGLEETLTVLHLGVPRTLARTVRSTNCIVFCRRHFP